VSTLLLIAPILLATARAEDPVHLRPTVVVADKMVRLGDIFDSTDVEKAEIPVAYAPEPGRRAVYDARWLYRLARRHKLSWRPRDRHERVVVERESQIVGRERIYSILSAALRERGAADRHEMTLDNPGQRIHVAAEAPPDVNVREFWYDADSGRFSALLAAVAQEASPPIRVAGRVFEVAEVPVPARAIGRDEVIEAEDIEWLTLRTEQLSRGAVTGEDQLIGMAPRRGLRAGETVRASDLRRPVVVAKGSIVTMIYRTSTMVLTAKARAIENGSHGDIIRVMNTDSKKVVDARVVDPDTVSIEPRTATLVN